MEIEEGKSLSIACYGPSLADTWQELTRPILSVSGALHYLAERGVIPDYHLDCDPRPHKVRHVQPAIDGVHYIMGSCCAPETWKALAGQKVTLVHFYMGEDTEAFLSENDPGAVLIRPGSTVGMAAIHVAGMLGYRHFEIHGMDGCIRDGKRHAGPHYGHSQGGVTWDAGGVTYQTSQIMANACAEVINSCRMFPIFPVFHGRGLQQALIAEERDLPNAAALEWDREKAEVVRKAKALIIGYAPREELGGINPDDVIAALREATERAGGGLDGIPGHNLYLPRLAGGDRGQDARDKAA